MYLFCGSEIRSWATFQMQKDGTFPIAVLDTEKVEINAPCFEIKKNFLIRLTHLY
jgi:hypothetical protein